jgi:hypothetical protein
MSSSAKTSTRKTAAAKKDVAAPAAAVATPAPVAPIATPAPVAPPAPIATPAPVAAAAPAVVEEVNVVTEFNALVEKVNKLRSAFTEVFSEMKKLEKRIPRELKKASKGRRNRKAAEGGEDKPKKDSVFTRPVQVSDDLCTFFGKPKGTLMTRSEVTSAVCAYAKSKGLMDKQVIKADAPLRKLLKITEKDELKILNLQSYLKDHYIKAATA